MEPIIHAQQLVAQFKARHGGGIWLNVDRNQVADGLQDRLMNSNLIAQNNTNLCGIAAFVSAWAKDDPVGYAWLGISLFEAGWGRIGRGSMFGKEVRPSADLKNAPIPHMEKYYRNGHARQMNHADWIILASVREAFNTVFTRYTGTDPLEPIQGMATPGEVVQEFKAAGYTTIIEKTNWALGEGYDNINEASRYLQSKWRVVLLINMRMLDDATIDTEARLIRTSDHWIRLTSPIQMNLVGKDYIISPFKVFTWGKEKQVPDKLPSITLPTFLKNYYGFIAAKY
jgi:hypothetical protein